MAATLCPSHSIQVPVSSQNQLQVSRSIEHPRAKFSCRRYAISCDLSARDPRSSDRPDGPTFSGRHSVHVSSRSASTRPLPPSQSLAGGALVGNSDGDERLVITGGGDNGTGRGNYGNGGFSGDGAGGAGDGDGDGEAGDEFGPILDQEQIRKVIAAEGITLPTDMAECAKTFGIPAVFLERYIGFQKGPFGPFIRGSALFRDRMLADPSFLFKIATEVAIDSGCATFAEVQKRGDDFWKEFDLYASDLLVGIVMDVALVGMLAPTARFGGGAPAVSRGLKGKLMQAMSALPNSIFEAALPGQSYSAQQRIATWFVKAGQYGAVGCGCGYLGQALANSIIKLKRRFRKAEDGEEEVRLPSVVQTALLWGVFMAISSNTRYQIINGLEVVVEGSKAARAIPLFAPIFTVGIRFANNVYGGMQFVDWARLSGVQ